MPARANLGPANDTRKSMNDSMLSLFPLLIAWKCRSRHDAAMVFKSSDVSAYCLLFFPLLLFRSSQNHGWQVAVSKCADMGAHRVQRDSDEDAKSSEEGSAAQALLDELKDVASPE